MEEKEMDQSQFADIKASVRERYPDVPWVDVYTEPLWRGRSPNNITRLTVRPACVIGRPVADPSTEHEYCVMSEQYKIVRPELAIHLFEESLKGYDEYGDPTITIKTFGDGAKWLAEALFPSKVKIDGREVSPRAAQKNSLDLGWEYQNLFGAYDWICTNGMVAGHLETKSKGKHRLNLDVKDQTAKLTRGMESMSEQFGIWGDWAKKKLDKAQAEGFLESVKSITEPAREKILALPITGRGANAEEMIKKGQLTVWKLHEAVTQFYTHEVNESVSRIEREEKIAKQFHRVARKLAA